MIRNPVSIEQALEVLNRAVRSDREAVENLLDQRVECNDTLADDPEIQIGLHLNGKSTLSFLGLLNGIFGENEDRWGAIVAVYKLRCSENWEHEVSENQLRMDACKTCGGELVLGDLVGFDKTTE